MLMPAPPAMPIDPPSATAANRGLSFKVPPLSTWIENTEAIS
jgi:hypothetical protein